MSSELRRIQEEIRATIQTGAPLYNSGDHKGCSRLYRGLATELLSTYRSSDREPRDVSQAMQRLARGLKEASNSNDHSKSAWALRHAFDEIGELRRESKNRMPLSDMEDAVIVRSFSAKTGVKSCRSPQNCGYPKCGCEERAPVFRGSPSACAAPNYCKYPNCNCGQVYSLKQNPGWSAVPKGCRRPNCCRSPDCKCAG